jgi:hypothetical protein
LLADCGVEGCAEAVLLAHGFTVAQMVELDRAVLATATPQRVKAGRERMEVATLADHGWHWVGSRCLQRNEFPGLVGPISRSYIKS